MKISELLSKKCEGKVFIRGHVSLPLKMVMFQEVCLANARNFISKVREACCNSNISLRIS